MLQQYIILWLPWSTDCRETRLNSLIEAIENVSKNIEKFQRLIALLQKSSSMFTSMLTSTFTNIFMDISNYELDLSLKT